MKEKFLKILSYAVKALGVFLLCFVLLAFAHSFGYLTVASNFGILGYDEEWLQGSDSLQVVTSVAHEFPPFLVGIVPGDTISKINGKKLVRADFDFNNYFGEPIIGKKAEVTFLKYGSERDYQFEFLPAPLYDKFLEVLFRMIPALLMMGYVLVGFWGLVKSPFSRETILIALFCFCFGSFMYASIGFTVKIETFVSKYLYFYEITSVLMLISIFASSFWVLLFATFPKRFSFYQSNRLISYIFVFLLPIIVLMSTLFNLRVSPFIIIGLMFVNMGIGVMLLSYNTRRATTALEQRQIKLMFVGIKYGAIAIGFGWLIVFFVQLALPPHLTVIKYIGLTVFLIGEIAGLIIPFTFLNSFFQNKLLETQTALKRRIRYIGGTIALLSVYLLLIFIVGRAWVNIFNITDPTLIIVFVLIISLTFTPINKRLLRWLDEKFYPERTKYTESLRQFIQNISGYIESSDLLNDLSEWIKKTTGIHPIIPVVYSNGALGNIPFYREQQNSVIHRIKSGDKFFWDEITERSRGNVNNNEFEWAKHNEISVTLPMISRGELMGVLNVGKKSNREDYSAEDLEILTQASTQAALALQNMKLQSEYIHKKRMDKELEMARKIQKRLMPQIIPDVEGLDIIGECRPCNEVAGDYFDIINLEDGNTVIVVADVSGKGAGAAMIMANLQASIRLGIHLSDKLADFVTRVNNLIFSNTSSSEFITFFMGIWDPKKRILYYVNAGHNPPVMVDKDNNITELHATGIILGILANQVYEEKYVKIEKDSVLFIYTDGLEEALNPNGEMFGQERIINCIKENKEKSSLSISGSITYEALRFCSGTALHDDVTMIIAKGK